WVRVRLQRRFAPSASSRPTLNATDTIYPTTSRELAKHGLRSFRTAIAPIESLTTPLAAPTWGDNPPPSLTRTHRHGKPRHQSTTRSPAGPLSHPRGGRNPVHPWRRSYAPGDVRRILPHRWRQSRPRRPHPLGDDVLRGDHRPARILHRVLREGPGLVAFHA